MGRFTDADDARTTSTLTQGLGWFSLALGVTQLVAPGLVNRLIDCGDGDNSRRLQRAVGVQELGAAAGIFASRRPVAVLWARAAGDVAHIAMVSRAYRRRDPAPARPVFTLSSLVGCLLLDTYAAVRISSTPEPEQEVHDMKGTATITIQGEIDELVERWRSFETGPDPASRLGPIEIAGGEPRGGIEWHTTPAASRQAHGVTSFGAAPGERGTEIRVSVEFDVTGGPVGEAVMKVAGEEPTQLVRDDLRRLKQLVEVGEIARSEGAPSGSSAKAQPKQRPAQPLATTSA